MNLKKGEIVEIKITDLAFGGAGVGKLSVPDGEFVVFVENTVPGDIVSVKMTKIKKQYGEAKLEKIEKPSEERIQARCKHFGTCGGCSLQFMAYESQLKWKQKMVEDAIRKLGGFADFKIKPIIGCEEPWFYRNKMEYTFGTGQSLTLGLHPKRNYKEVFDLEECFLQSPLSVEIVTAVKRWAKSKKLTAYDPRVNSGLLRNLVIREGKNTNETLVNLVTNGDEIDFKKEFSEWICGTFPQITSLYHTAVSVQKGKRTLIEEHLLTGKKTLTEALNMPPSELRFEILPQSFFQTNTKQAEVLYGKILELATPPLFFKKSGGVVLDLFCGTGTIGMFFAKTSHKVYGVDISASAIENAKENAKKNNLSNIEFVCGDVDKAQFPVPSLLITDPPRAGIAPKTLQKILTLKTPRWIYISCNPATLARDLKIICKEGYKITRIQPVDMFPHTYHIETVCRLDLM